MLTVCILAVSVPEITVDLYRHDAWYIALAVTLERH